MLPGKQYSFDDIVAIARRRLWSMAIPAVVISIATAIVLALLPNKYRADTLILVVPQRVPETYVKATVTARIEDRLQSISQQILSRTRLERIIHDFDLYKKERDTSVMEDVVERMRGDIKVQMVKGDAFRVSYVAENPQVAFKVTERLASLFIEENLRDREVLAEATNQFLETQLEDARRRLVDQEQQVEHYRLKYAGELPSELQSNLQVVQTTQTALQSLSDSINRDRDRRLVLERSVMEVQADALDPPAAEPPAPAADPTTIPAGSAAAQLDAAKRSLAALEVRLKPQHPDVVRLKRLVAELEQKARDESAAAATGAAPSAPRSKGDAARDRRIDQMKAEMAGIDLQIADKTTQQKAMQDKIAAYQARIAAVPVRESELTALTRDYDTLRKVYDDLLAKREDSKVAANLERRQIGEQFKVLDPARLPEKPVSPKRLLLFPAGVLGGLAAGIALAALLEYRDTSLRTADDVIAALALPVVAVVPTMWTAAERRSSRRKAVMWSCAAAIAIAAAAAVAFKFSGTLFL